MIRLFPRFFALYWLHSTVRVPAWVLVVVCGHKRVLLQLIALPLQCKTLLICSSLFLSLSLSFATAHDRIQRFFVRQPNAPSIRPSLMVRQKQKRNWPSVLFFFFFLTPTLPLHKNKNKNNHQLWAGKFRAQNPANQSLPKHSYVLCTSKPVTAFFVAAAALQRGDRTMAGTRTRFRLQKVEQTNNPPLYSCWAYYLTQDDAKKRLIGGFDHTKFNKIRKNNPQHNTTLFSQQLKPISTKKTPKSQQSNVTIV